MKSLQIITSKPWLSLGVYLSVFFLTAVFLNFIDFIPEAPEEKEIVQEKLPETTVTLTDVRIDAQREAPVVARTVTASEAPTKIVIPRIGVNTPIENPVSTNLEILDNALLRGAVRYPGSALLGQNATVFLFGHQSGLPVVRNQAFKAFNDLQKLVAGDVIYVSSSTTRYEYHVRSVSLVKAEDALIPLSQNEGNLVLSTCNSFGTPGDRYIVDAELISQTSLI